MFKMKNLVVGMLVVGSLSMVGCQSTMDTNPNENLTPDEIVAATEDGSFQLGVYDGEQWVEKGDFTLGDVSKKSLAYAIIENFNPEEYYKGLLSVVSFGDKGNDKEDLKALMDEWERCNGKGEEKAEDKKEEKSDDKKHLSLKESASIAQSWVRKNVGSDCDIQYEQTAQDEDKLVADVYQAGETVVGFIEVDRYSSKVKYTKSCSECGKNGHSYWDCGELYKNNECSNCGTTIEKGATLCDDCANAETDNYSADGTCGLCGGHVSMSKKEGYCDVCGARHIYDRDGSVITAD